MSFECPEGYIPTTLPCPKCKSTFYDYKANGPHMEVRCVRCGSHITYVKKMNKGEWRRAVKIRDRYTCQRCGIQLTAKGVEAHHKMPQWFLPSLEFDLDNGITLCKSCHKQLHGVDGTIKENYEEEIKEDNNNE